MSVALAFGMPVVASLLLASLAMSTSPAAVMRVINEQRSSGQVTERVMHLTAVNCVLAVFVFKVIVGFWTFQTSGSVWQAVSNSWSSCLHRSHWAPRSASACPACCGVSVDSRATRRWASRSA